MFEDLEPRPQRGEPLRALSREDLDVYAVEDLQERIAALEAEAFAAAGYTAASTELPGQGTSTIGVGRRATPTGYHDAAAKDFPLSVDTLRAHTADPELPL